MRNSRKTITNILNYLRSKKYHYQIKKKFIGKEIKIADSYKEEIEDYWKKYDLKINTNYHLWMFSRNGQQDPKYIPEDIFYQSIVPFFNNSQLAPAFSDKSYYSSILPDVELPEVYAKNINGRFYNKKFELITIQDVLDKCSSKRKIIIKPTLESGGGKGFIVLEENDSEKMVKELKKILFNQSKDYIIQEFLIQHEDLNILNETSVNTIRTMSFFDDGGIKILGSHIRSGLKGANHDHFGIVYGINSSGEVYDYGIESHNGNVIPLESIDKNISKVVIPNYNKMIKIIKQSHLKLPHFGLIAWDFAIRDDSTPILIELNIRYPGVNNHQLLDGPLFGDMTDKILNQVFTMKQ